MTIIKLVYGYKGGETPQPKNEVTVNEPVALPTEEPTPVASASAEDVKDYPLWQKLPYSGDGFVIDRYAAPKTLVVKSRAVDKKLVLQEVMLWLTNQGVGLTSHKIVWEQ